MFCSHIESKIHLKEKVLDALMNIHHKTNKMGSPQDYILESILFLALTTNPRPRTSSSSQTSFHRLVGFGKHPEVIRFTWRTELKLVLGFFGPPTAHGWNLLVGPREAKLTLGVAFSLGK